MTGKASLESSKSSDEDLWGAKYQVCEFRSVLATGKVRPEHCEMETK